jgi:pimeloyl-ACP methyl ester carboxylesterase
VRPLKVLVSPLRSSDPSFGGRRAAAAAAGAPLNDPEVVDAYARAAAEVEEKTATGPQLDMVTIMPMINARLMPVPTMIIHGEYDDVADVEGLLPFFKEIPDPYKKYVIIPDAGHMMHLQEGHRMFQHEATSFFKGPEEP